MEKHKMKKPQNRWPTLSASALALGLAFALAGCAAGGAQQGPRTHLSATQCNDLGALKSGAPVTHQRNLSELAALEEAGYRPALGLDPYYPADLEAAQRLVDQWYQQECQQPSAPVTPG
jgi:hypothetical protein